MVGLWPEVRRSRMADITSSAAASAARPQPDVVGMGVGVGVGVGVGRTGVTEFDTSEDRLVPTEFVAVTVKVYAVPLVRPVTVTDVPVVVAVTPPGADVAVYSVIGVPPSEAGAVHETIA